MPLTTLATSPSTVADPSLVAPSVSPDPVIQLLGAAAILLAFLALQLGWTGARRLPYLAANAIGAGLLAFEAARTEQIGFLVLEGTWATVSVIAALRVLLGGGASTPADGDRAQDTTPPIDR